LEYRLNFARFKVAFYSEKINYLLFEKKHNIHALLFCADKIEV